MKKLRKATDRTTKQPQVRGVPADQLITVTGGALNPIMPIPSSPGESVIVTPTGGGSGGTVG